MTTATTERLECGAPWLGFNDARKRHEIHPSEIAADSENWELLTLSGKLQKRRGMLLLSGECLEVVYVPGPPIQYRFRGDYVQEMYSDALRETSGRPVTVAILFTDEDDSANSYACLWYYDQYTSPFNRRICDQIATFYPTATGGAQACLPTNDIAGPRFQTADHRARHAMGSRSFLSVGGRTYFPVYGDRNYNTEAGMPHHWNNTHPTGASAAGRIERVRPTGHQPPMWCPRITARNAAAANQPAPWSDRDAFFVSLIYEWEDGSVSRPALPRTPQSTGFLTAANVIQRYSGLGASMGGVGFVRLNTSGSATYGSITWSGIPQPPAGVTRIGLLRTQKVQADAAGALTTIPDLKTLGLVAWLPVGQKTYEDPDGYDAANFPLADSDLIRIEGEDTWPARARHMWRFDGRIAIGDLKENLGAILVTLVHGQAGNQFDMNDTDVNVAFVGATLGDDFRFRAWVRVTTDSAGIRALYLYARDYNGGVPLSWVKRVALTGYTLQEIVDAINGGYGNAAPFTAGGETGETTTAWAAQLRPGADPNALATNLADTATGTNPYGDSCPNDGVLSRGTLTTLESTGTEDDVIRAFGPGMPVVLQFSSTYAQSLPRIRAGLQFTEGGPNQANLAPNSYLVKNFREGDQGVGRVMGGGGLLDGCLVGFSNATGVLRNFKDGKSGFDDDYLLVTRGWGLGWISSSFAEGPGFVVGLTKLGVVASDGDDWKLIAPGLFSPTSGAGVLAYEIGECVKAQGQDTHGDYFHVAVANGRIWISFRSSASVTRPDRWMFMDFSPGIAQSGLPALFDDRPEIFPGVLNPGYGKPFGWGPPFKPADTLTDQPGQGTIAPGAMGAFHDPVTGTTMLVGTRDRHDSTAGVEEGHVWKLDTGVLDGATAYAPLLFGRTNTAPNGTQKMMPRKVVIRFYDVDNVLTASHARSARAHTTNPSFFTSQGMGASNAAEPYTEFEWDLPLPTRGLTEASELKIAGAASGANRPEIFGLVYEYDLVETK